MVAMVLIASFIQVGPPALYSSSAKILHDSTSCEATKKGVPREGNAS
jgi:hypothetical protein